MRKTSTLHTFLMGKCAGLALLFALIGCTGCAANPKAGLDQAVADYNAQRFAKAHERAKSISNQSSAPNRHEAAYIAGISAYQLAQINDAEHHLLMAIGAETGETAARSRAMLGQIRLDQRRWRDAATLLAQAADSLSGEDRLKAAANVSLAYQNLGDLDSARKWRAVSNGQSAQNTSPHASAMPSLETTIKPAGGSSVGFTLQVGAFQEKSRAENAAKEALRVARREGWGQVRIVPKRDERGKPTYLVQIGAFTTREAAAAARTRIGRLDYIVAVANSKAS